VAKLRKEPAEKLRELSREHPIETVRSYLEMLLENGVPASELGPTEFVDGALRMMNIFLRGLPAEFSTQKIFVEIIGQFVWIMYDGVDPWEFDEAYAYFIARIQPILLEFQQRGVLVEIPDLRSSA
jgi:hypothetical protein